MSHAKLELKTTIMNCHHLKSKAVKFRLIPIAILHDQYSILRRKQKTTGFPVTV